MQSGHTLAQPNLKANDIIVWRHNVCGHLLTRLWRRLSLHSHPAFHRAEAVTHLGSSSPGEGINTTSHRLDFTALAGAGDLVRRACCLLCPLLFFPACWKSWCRDQHLASVFPSVKWGEGWSKSLYHGLGNSIVD